MASFTFFELHTPDLQRAKAFYGELFQWKFNDLDLPGPKFALAEEGGPLSGAMMEDARPFWLNYVTVDDAVEAGKKAERLGGKILRERTVVPGAGAFVVVADPLGAPMALWEACK